MLMGLPGDNSYANYREANRALWRSAILPLTGKILGALAQGLAPWFAGVRLHVDIDRVPALGRGSRADVGGGERGGFPDPGREKGGAGNRGDRMMSGAILAQLLAQAEDKGADLTSLRGIVEEAGELGAVRALKRLGLDDASAAKDMAELRELLGAWREAKRSAVKATIGWVIRMLLALVLIGLAVRTGFWGAAK